MADRVSRRGKKKTVQFRGMFVWNSVFYFYNIFLPVRFSKTNSTDLRKRVPLRLAALVVKRSKMTTSCYCVFHTAPAIRATARFFVMR